jgi:hypothetical protein
VRGEIVSKFDEFKTERPLNGGVQKSYRFPNGWGASVVRHRFSYGHEDGLWELAVLGKDGHLAYETTITDDVIGRQTDEEIEALLARISTLPGDGQEVGVDQRNDKTLARGLEALASLADAAKSGEIQFGGES